MTHKQQPSLKNSNYEPPAYINNEDVGKLTHLHLLLVAVAVAAGLVSVPGHILVVAVADIQRVVAS